MMKTILVLLLISNAFVAGAQSKAKSHIVEIVLSEADKLAFQEHDEMVRQANIREDEFQKYLIRLFKGNKVPVQLIQRDSIIFLQDKVVLKLKQN